MIEDIMFIQLIQDVKIQAFTGKSVCGTLINHPEHYRFHSQDQYDQRNASLYTTRNKILPKKEFFFWCEYAGK